jgi:hypothetical protein
MSSGTTKYDKDGLTFNQRLLLEYLEPGTWFDPEDNKNLRLINSRVSACKQLANKNILLKRPFSDLGYISFQYCLPKSKAKELSIVQRVIENE